MKYPAFTRDEVMHVELADGYALRSAPEREFGMTGVRPEYRRRGLAARMVQNALTVRRGQRPTLKFGVAAGNPAEALYHRLGFLAGPVHYVLVMPPDRAAECDEDQPQQERSDNRAKTVDGLR